MTPLSLRNLVRRSASGGCSGWARTARRYAGWRAITKRSGNNITNARAGEPRQRPWNRMRAWEPSFSRSTRTFRTPAGRWPHGEEWVHEAVLGTYLPLLVLLHDLRDAGLPYRIVIGLTPILIEQLADRDLNVRTLEYIDDQVLRAGKDLRRFADAGDRAHAELADF